MAKRRRLEAPAPEDLARMAEGFAAKPVFADIGLNAIPPIAQIAGDAARVALPYNPDQRLAMARDGEDAAAWRQARQDGRVMQDLPLDAIDASHLMRDRIVVDSADLEELAASIRTNGLRLPIEVMPVSDGSYGLISGWRRLAVFRMLQATDGPAWSHIRALVRDPVEAPALYTAMVEENELRAQISPYERGRIAVVAAELGAFADTDAAIATIFAAASKAKRSKIRSFALVHAELGDMLQSPTDMSERNGLRLAHALREGFGPQLRHALIKTPLSDAPGAAADEWALLEPIVAAAEAAGQATGPAAVNRGGRPRNAPHKPATQLERLATGISMEHVVHEDGFSIRLRGAQLDAARVDRLMLMLRQQLENL
jgi:ParB family transcriptional regulator, chromosome partitioning protein